MEIKNKFLFFGDIGSGSSGIWLESLVGGTAIVALVASKELELAFALLLVIVDEGTVFFLVNPSFPATDVDDSATPSVDLFAPVSKKLLILA